MNHGAEDGASLLRQPRAVWAVAFACVAPYVAGKLADHFGLHVPFLVGAGAFLLAVPVLATGHRILAAAERPIEDRLAEAEAELAVVAG